MLPLAHRLIAAAWIAACVSPSALATPAPSTQPAEQVNFLSMGDWGLAGAQQEAVARAMSAYVSKHRIRFDAVLLNGDNFTDELTGVDDPRWQSLFEKMYDPKVLDMPFHPVFGNWDYWSGNAEFELAYARRNPQSRWKLPSRWYRLDFPKDRPLVTVLMLDSNRDRLTDEQWAAQKQWIEVELAKVGGKRWTICVAHHPLFSNGIHGDNAQLQREWGVIFNKHNVDFCLSGHDHDMQYLEFPNWRPRFVVAGGGGQDSRPIAREDRGPFAQSLNGFVHLLLGEKKATVRFIDTGGREVHRAERAMDDLRLPRQE